MDWAVELRQVSKRFTIRRNPALNIKVKVLGLFDSRYREYREEFWAVRDVDLAIRHGEVLGLIGPNGSGKSTLLRMMAGISPPTHGEVVVRGRLAPMIELGVGFHFELTGRENIFLSTSLFGMSDRRTRALLPEIVAFAELDHFIDVPVKNYSTGMYARLGFAVAVHLDPDVLLVDEILAVGDERFQEKCLRRMGEFRERGKTMVLVSHDMKTVQRMCDRVCLLVDGRLDSEGDPAKVIERYREVLNVGSGV